MSEHRPQPRTLGFDEGPFRFGDPDVPVVGVMTRGAHEVEAVLVDRVTVDGWDATERILDMTARLPGAGPDLILLDGITLGGMNLVDLSSVAQNLGRPVLGVTRRPPDRVAMMNAIARTTRPEKRLAALPHGPPVDIEVQGRRLSVQAIGPDGRPLEGPEVVRILTASMGKSGLPEPLRLAHHFATALVRGVSGTKA